MHCRKLILIICLTILGSGYASAQNDIIIYNKNWEPVKNVNNAVYFIKTNKINDTTYVSKYYNINGPMLQLNTFKDSSLQIPHGLFIYYNTNGTIDSTGFVVNGKKDKDWFYNYNNSFSPTIVELFIHGKLQIRYNKHTNIVERSSVSPEQEAILVNRLLDTSHIPSLFKDGGISGWVNYLSSAIVTPTRLIKIVGPNTINKAVVQFEVSTDGIVQNPMLLKSLEQVGR